MFLKTLGGAASTLFLPKFGFAQTSSLDKPNVLFIAVDDLRTELGCYGNKSIHSPNIDALATNGILFERAYCQEPICMASRASLLSGYRPDYAHIYNCASLKKLVPTALTLNKHFSANGYRIWATGKIYHHQEDHLGQFGKNWINPQGDWIGRGYLAPEAKNQVEEYARIYDKTSGGESDGRGPAFEAADVADEAYSDGKKTDYALEQLNHFSKSDLPFFLAVGYNKPHLPFNAPKKYWDMYDPKKIALPNNPFLPKNATQFTPYNFAELRNYYGIPKDERVLPDDLARTLIHGYYACVTYIDTQIGRLINELDRLKLKDNTVIVLWGDHGWKLGEHGMWCKHTPFELDARVPMIFSIPGLNQGGKRIGAFAEFVDIYPTLCDVCGIPIPGHLEGNSLLPVIMNPHIRWKEAAFTQWPKLSRNDPEKVITAYSIKTDRYRYIEWTRNSTGEVLARELYDHSIDPDENENIADDPAKNQLVAHLSLMLDGGRGWKNIRP
jgi:iduronate 2-sulfatase